MQFLKDLSIRIKILVPVAIMGIMMIVLGFIAFNGSSQINSAGEEISESYALSIEQICEIASTYQSMRRVAFAHIVSEDNASTQKLENEANSLRKEIRLRPEEKSAFQKFETDYNAYVEVYTKVPDYSRVSRNEDTSH